MGTTIDEYNAVKEYHACVGTIIDKLWTDSVKYHMLQDDLKSDMIAILEELNTEIEETFKKEEPIDKRWAYGLRYSKNFIQQKINNLREGQV
jgi:protoheme ferro-lyase